MVGDTLVTPVMLSLC